ncbi:MAG TPA: dockerin type I domain-containing protein [Tepidisphaeraceae bacterium]|nr:dockerin type I domain-containing protein [Tepidisphaeraceae bacterium]
MTIGNGFPAITLLNYNNNVVNIHSLSLASPLLIKDSIVDIATTANLSATLTVSNGTLRDATVTGSGGQIVADTSPGTGGSMSNLTINADVKMSGSWVVTNGFTVNGTLTAATSSQFAFDGTQTLGGSGALVGAAPFGTRLSIQSPYETFGATLTIGSGMTVRDASIDDYYNPLGTEWLENGGTIVADLPGYTFTVANVLKNFVCGGTVEATGGGALAVYHLGGAIGAVQVSGANSSVTLTGGNWQPSQGLMASAGTTLTLAGTWTNPAGSTISANAATLNLDGSFNNPGTINAVDSTVNLGGSFSSYDLTGFHRTGGVVNLIGSFFDYGNTLALNSTTGSWNLAGGTIYGGTIASGTGGATLNFTARSTFDAVTLSEPLTIDSTANSLVIQDGLILNATLTIGSGQTDSGGVTFVGTQTLGGNAEILLADGPAARNGIGLASINTTTPMTLTVGPGIFIHGGTRLGATNNPNFGAAIDGGGTPGQQTLINQGTIDCDVPGAEISLFGSTIVNNGTLKATAGGTIVASGMSGNANAIQVTGAGSVLSLDGKNWVNNQPITTSAGTTLSFFGTWMNTGGISVMGGNFYIGGTITFASLGTITRNGGTVTLVGTLDDSGTTLALTAASGSWDLAGGTIKNGTITTSGSASLLLTTFSTSTLDGVTLNTDLIVNGSPLNVLDGLILNGTLTIDGMAQFTGTQILGGIGQVLLGGSIIVASPNGSTPAALTIGTGITLHGGSPIAPNGATIGGYYGNGRESFINQGVINADAASQKITLGDFRLTSVTNSGTLEATHGGALVVNNLVGNANLLQVTDMNSAVNLNGTNWVNNQPVAIPVGTSLGFQGSFTNTGGINVTGGTFYLGGIPANINPQVLLPAVKTAGLGPITNAGGTIAITGLIDNTGATLSFPGSWNLNGGTIKNGIVSGAGAAGPVTVVAGTLDGATFNTDVTVAGGSLLNVIDGLTLNGNLTVNGGATQSGYVQFTGTQTLAGSGQVYLIGAQTSAVLQVNTQFSPTTLTVGPGIAIDGRGTSDAIKGYYVNWTFSLVNQGMIECDVAGSVLTIANYATVANSGTLEATNGGSLQLQKTSNLSAGTLSGGTWEVFASGLLTLPTSVATIAANVILDGQGSIIADSTGVTNALAGLSAIANGASVSLQGGQGLSVTPAGGTFTNHGSITLGAGGQLSVAGAFIQAADATLAVEVPDPIAAGFGQISATGAATLAGTLHAMLGTGYDPAAGQTFPVVVGSSRVGSFSSFSGGTTPGGLPLLLNYSATSAIISINSIPLSYVRSQIDDGTVQRSVVRSLTFSFSSPVTLSAGAITLALLNTGHSGTNDGSTPTDASAALGTPTTSDGGLTWTIPIVATSAFSSFGSLTDGIYTATVHAALVTDAFNQHLSGGDQTKTFHRLFGDLNGDQRVNSLDYGLFTAAFGSKSTQANYVIYFDFNHDGRVNALDYGQFGADFGKSLVYTAN